MAKVWLITGSGNGLGRDIAEAALATGDSVVAGARRTEELEPLVAQYGGRVKPVTLEVRDGAAAKAAVQLAVDSFGRLDVLVNNAGYGQFAPFEQMSAEDFQAIVDTCFYGVVYTTRAAVPVMRKQKKGHIFSDCYETRVVKRFRAMFRVPEHRFFVWRREFMLSSRDDWWKRVRWPAGLHVACVRRECSPCASDCRRLRPD
jgi:enoyl-[acyl-carrier-protein] reductase (NADH)